MKGMRYESADVTDVDRFIANDLWAMEQKVDGIRCIARIDDTGHTTFLSHTGDVLKSGVRHHAQLASALSGLRSCTLDGELLETGHLWLFDVMEVCGTDVRLLPQQDRRALLAGMAPLFDHPRCPVAILPQAVTATEKAALWAAVLAASAEGVVVKRKAAGYSLAKGRTSDVLKVKVTRTIDVVVMARNSKGHLNATLGLHDADGQLVEVGACSMIGKADAQPGDVIEVQFLYVVDPANPALYQARMMRPRPDKSPAECEMDQLNGCAVSKSVLTEAS